MPSRCTSGGRRVPGTAVGERARGGVEDAAEDGGAQGTRQPVGEAVERGQGVRRAAGLQQQRPAGAAQLAHHRGRGESPADAVADDDADPVAGQRDDVVPVAADFQGRVGRLVPHREAVGQPGRAEDRPLQRDRDLPLPVVAVGAAQGVRQRPGQQRQQRPVLGAEGTARFRLHPERQPAVGVVEGRAGAAVGRGGVQRRQRARPRRASRAAARRGRSSAGRRGRWTRSSGSPSRGHVTASTRSACHSSRSRSSAVRRTSGTPLTPARRWFIAASAFSRWTP